MSKIGAVIIPFIYAILFIFVPIKLFNTNYGWSVIILFWIPAILLYVSMSLGKKISSARQKAFWATTLIMIPVTFLFEYLCLYLDIWGFHEDIHKLWGIKIWGAPIEEFLFWFGATPFCLMVYLYFRNIFKPSRVSGT
ncbi:MAG: lycopene cyclase domain-containing protein [Chitinivibrionales bacterium]|nr:lycopene cyclase domain-containing protein [Chitinivibrionales bacterium]